MRKATLLTILSLSLPLSRLFAAENATIPDLGALETLKNNLGSKFACTEGSDMFYTAAVATLAPFIDGLKDQDKKTSQEQLKTIPMQIALLKMYIMQNKEEDCQKVATKIQDFMGKIITRIDAAKKESEKK